jgi:sec-independent protein translocase protein TatA
MGWDAPWHWVVLAIIVIALFGYKKLPDAARSLGRSLRIFRTEIKGMGADDAARAAKDQPAVEPPPPAPQQPASPVVASPPPAVVPPAPPAPSPAAEQQLRPDGANSHTD